jgi:7-cyano-7-deazaguanine synthase in queuosine biosynthesis
MDRIPDPTHDLPLPRQQSDVPKAAADGSANLLWTGGWDSTFQLLRLLLLHRRRVVPFYLVDPKRPSTRVELATMDRIREKLAAMDPQTIDLLAPTQCFQVDDLAPDPDIEAAFAASAQEAYMGNQYAWLARFCQQRDISDMQLCIHRDDKAHHAIEQFVYRDSTDGATTYRFDPQFADTNQYRVFRYFSFPLFETTKLEMARVAAEQGWEELMHMTWFCHRPRRNQQPCGRCNPCLYTIDEGLGWRIPASSRMTSAIYRTFVRPLKAPAKALLERLRRSDR